MGKGIRQGRHGRSALTDYSGLYEQIGDIVIERASAGDVNCLEIYERAWKITKRERAD